MNAFLKTLSDFFASLASAEQVVAYSYQTHEIKHFLQSVNTQFDLHMNVNQAMQWVNSLKPSQLASTALDALFCGCPHTVEFTCEYRTDGFTMQFKSASMPLEHAINSALKTFEPSGEIENFEFASAA